MMLTAIIVTLNFKWRNTPERIVDRMDKTMAEFSNRMDLRLKFLDAVFYKADNDALSNRDTLLGNVWEKDCQVFLKYRKDSLVFWTSSNFYPPAIKKDELLDKAFVNIRNGWYLVRQLKSDSSEFFALQLVYSDYKIHNAFFYDHFYEKIKVPNNLELSFEKTAYVIASPEGKYLFSLVFEGQAHPDRGTYLLILLTYLISILLLIEASFLLYRRMQYEVGKTWILFSTLLVNIFILRALQIYLRFPLVLYESEFFSPKYFASSIYLPSLGDFLLNALILLQLSFFMIKNWPQNHYIFIKNRILKYCVAAILIFFLILLFEGMCWLMNNLLVNSNVPMELDRVLSLSFLSLVELVIIACLIFSFLFVFNFISKNIFGLLADNKTHFRFLCFSVLLVYGGIKALNSDFQLIPFLFLLGMFALVSWQNYFELPRIKNKSLIPYLFLFAFLGTYMLTKSETYRETEHRKLIALKLSDASDKKIEYHYETLHDAIMNDQELDHGIQKFSLGEIQENELVDYVLQKYLTGFWEQYQVKLKFCKNTEVVSELCPEEIFYDSVIKHSTRLVLPRRNLYLLQNSLDDIKYIGLLNFRSFAQLQKTAVKLYIEIGSPNTELGIGFSEGLSNNLAMFDPYASEYSYAYYEDNDLVKKAGTYYYDLKIPDQQKKLPDYTFFYENGYQHMIHRVDTHIYLVISKQTTPFINLIAPFSYIFFFLVIFIYAFNFIKYGISSFSRKKASFGRRLSLTILGSVLASSLLIGVVTLIFIYRMNKGKDNDIAKLKMQSIVTALAPKFEKSANPEFPQNGPLIKQIMELSQVYGTHINVYNKHGELLVSSQNQLFEQGLLPFKMDIHAFKELEYGKAPYYFHKEYIGKQPHTAVYSHLVNQKERELGFVNLPYATKQMEFRNEISSLLATFANIYVILTALATLLAWVLSKYISSPLKLIREKLKNVQLSPNNTKIEWRQDDEIGELVAEYNRMIDELAQKAELLARSERESAWRQMARQVAHEIKNPLTPMKLSVQHLKRGWDDKNPDFDKQLQRFTQTLVMQIDTLSAIATDFSDFAQMPEPKIEVLDIIPIINHSVGLFKESQNITIYFSVKEESCYILADDNQMLRVFNNLIKNAIQAIPPEREGLLEIKLKQTEKFCRLSFADNGLGISLEQQVRIFSPSFTTKSAGMGLGLTMVKNIVENIRGKIWFDSVEGEGTSFYLEFPLAQKNDKE